jgi:hypothetical protein
MSFHCDSHRIFTTVSPSILALVLLYVFLCPSANIYLTALDQIATAFIHLLSPALDELGSPCLAPAWQNYVSIPYQTILFGSLISPRQPYALALALLSIFSIFIVELIAFRWGTAKLMALDMKHGELHVCNTSLVEWMLNIL